MGHWGYVALAWAGGLLAIGVLIWVTFAAARRTRAELKAQEGSQ